MGFTFSINTIPATASIAMFNIKTQLKASGWTVPSSSDGTTYNSSGDQISSGNTGSGGLDNTNAWFVIQSPTINGYTRAFCMQRINASWNYRIKYSFNYLFNGGSPSATQTPAATNEFVILGGGTNASPTSGTAFNITNGSYRQEILIGDINDGYAFYSICFPVGGGAVNSAIMLDYLLPGSYSSADNDPYMAWADGNSTTVFTNTGDYNTFNACPYTWMSLGQTNQAMVRCPALLLCDYSSGANVINNALGTNAITSYDDIFPVIYGRRLALGAPGGYKGISKNIFSHSTSRNTGDTLSVASAGAQDRFVASAFNLPWNGTTPSV